MLALARNVYIVTIYVYREQGCLACVCTIRAVGSKFTTSIFAERGVTVKHTSQNEHARRLRAGGGASTRLLHTKMQPMQCCAHCIAPLMFAVAAQHTAPFSLHKKRSS